MFQMLEQGLSVVWSFMQDNPQFVLGSVGAVVLIMCINLHHYFLGRKMMRDRRKNLIVTIRRNRELWMTKPERERYLNSMLSDDIVHFVEGHIVDGEMTPEEGVIYYRRFGHLLTMPDLLQRHERLLKESLRRKYPKGQRISVKPIKFPDSKPESPNTGRGMIARFRSR